MKKYRFSAIVISICLILLSFTGCSFENAEVENVSKPIVNSINDISEFSDKPYVELNGNIPEFSSEDLVNESYETYSPLDSLGRCGVVMACIGFDIMPTTERGSIGQVKPSGWHTIKYDIVDGKYLYNRCHLIGYQLTGENANERNLITGTRYMNVEGMLPFENMVGDYVKETFNHVIYRVTPVFQGEELVARGVQMEAMSVEDGGEGICFNVFVYNCQPGIEINYANGQSACVEVESISSGETSVKYVLNTNTKKIHFSNCSAVFDINEKNREMVNSSIDELLEQGYTKCKRCNPQ